MRSIPVWLGALSSTAAQRRLLGLLAGAFALGLASSFVTPFLSPWGTRAIGRTPFEFGMFMTTTSFGAVVWSTLLARWSDTHVARRTVLLLAATGGALGYLGYATLTHPLALVATGLLLLGVSAANFPQLFAHACEELARPEYASLDAPFALSVLRAAFALAWTVGPGLGALGMRVASIGHRGVVLFCAALGALSLGVLLACSRVERAAGWKPFTRTWVAADPTCQAHPPLAGGGIQRRQGAAVQDVGP